MKEYIIAVFVGCLLLGCSTDNGVDKSYVQWQTAVKRIQFDGHQFSDDKRIIETVDGRVYQCRACDSRDLRIGDSVGTYHTRVEYKDGRVFESSRLEIQNIRSAWIGCD